MRNLSLPGLLRQPTGERQPLIRRRSFDEEYYYEVVGQEEVSATPLAGGTVLGLHNLAIVMPQFVVGDNAIRH